VKLPLNEILHKFALKIEIFCEITFKKRLSDFWQGVVGSWTGREILLVVTFEALEVSVNHAAYQLQQNLSGVGVKLNP